MVSDESVTTLDELPPILGCRLHSASTVAMDAVMQHVLDELTHMEGQLTDAMAGRCSELEHCVEALEEKTKAQLISLEMDHVEIESWRPMWRSV